MTESERKKQYNFGPRAMTVTKLMITFPPGMGDRLMDRALEQGMTPSEYLVSVLEREGLGGDER